MGKHKVIVIHGPNLDLLGERETRIYGDESLESVNAAILAKAQELDADCEIFQSNSEGEIIELLHSSRLTADGVVLNAGAYTHYSLAIRDAVTSIRIPCVEAHITNIYARESFRSSSVVAPVCCGQVSGFGRNSYLLALEGLISLL
jgi:3-dehydroquinate dehydratase-2